MRHTTILLLAIAFAGCSQRTTTEEPPPPDLDEARAVCNSRCDVFLSCPRGEGITHQQCFDDCYPLTVGYANPCIDLGLAKARCEEQMTCEEWEIALDANHMGDRPCYDEAVDLGQCQWKAEKDGLEP